MNIHLLKQGIPVGPYAESEMSEMLENNEARLSDVAWKEGNQEWTTIGHVMGLEPPPAPQTSTPPLPPVPPPQSTDSSSLPLLSPRLKEYIAANRFAGDTLCVIITGIDIPFISMVRFILKWSLATIMAIIVAMIVLAIPLLILAILIPNIAALIGK